MKRWDDMTDEERDAAMIAALPKSGSKGDPNFQSRVFQRIERIERRRRNRWYRRLWRWLRGL